MADRSIIVIGGGIIGSAVAFELASRGVSVRVFEARLPGQGATQASAGMLAPYTESRGSAAFQALCVEGLEAYDRFVTRVREHAAVPFEYERTGSVEVALDAASAQHLRLQAATLPPGLQARWLDASDALAEEPALTRSAQGALVIPAHGFVSPAGFTAALVSAASAVGAGFHTGTAVSAVHPRGPGIEITAGEYQAQADAVVVCAGAWAGRLSLADRPPLPIHPVRGQSIRLRPRVPIGSRILWGPRCYLVPWRDGTVLVGATVEDVGFDEATTAEGIATLIDAATELVPALGGAAFVEARAGLRPGSPDELPVLGPLPGEPRIVVASGHYRNGVLLAPVTAVMVSDLLLGARLHPALAALGPGRAFRTTAAAC